MQAVIRQPSKDVVMIIGKEGKGLCSKNIQTGISKLQWICLFIFLKFTVCLQKQNHLQVHHDEPEW